MCTRFGTWAHVSEYNISWSGREHQALTADGNQTSRRHDARVDHNTTFCLAGMAVNNLTTVISFAERCCNCGNVGFCACGRVPFAIVINTGKVNRAEFVMLLHKDPTSKCGLSVA